MQKLNFSTNINAPKEKVWKILWDDATYRKWTSVFFEGSYAVSDWKEGSKILFLGPGGGGMFSTIDKLDPNAFMSFKHMGVVKDGVEQPDTEETKAWAGAKETYTLTEKNGGTELTVNLDVTEDHAGYFNEAFPKALEIVKSLSEQ